jgi:hypothetical protein
MIHNASAETKLCLDLMQVNALGRDQSVWELHWFESSTAHHSAGIAQFERS